jgi:hypothetical protein
MTTVFGARHPNLVAGVLVADEQTTYLDQTGIPSGKHIGRKLWINKNKDYCFGHAGKRDEMFEEFAHDLCEKKFDVKKIAQKGYFPALRKLNIKRLGNKVPDMQEMSGIILLTNFDKNPKLYTCFPLGAVEERIWTCIGSGDQKIIEYMKALQVMGEARNYNEDDSQLKTKELIQIGLEAVRRAQSQDIYSHGLDIIVCTPDKGIVDHYKDLNDGFGKKLKRIQNKY